ncbi:SPOR domain-containing protein [bacterium]|nr:SPOR domain-containing protein [bacterium]
MAEDDLNLEDDDLDLGGDDFAGELDEMMGDDELGGESSGGGEEGDGDSELDSFFEDLSSIEDMDEGGAEPSREAAVASESHEKVVEKKAPAKTKKAKPKSEKKGGKLKFVILFLLLLMGGGAGAWYFLFNTGDLPEEEMSVVEEAPVQMIEIEKSIVRPKPIVPIMEMEPVPAPVKPAAPKKRYYIQVAKCSYDVCKEDYTESLRRDGEPVFQKSSGEKYDFIELVSKQVFNRRDAGEIARDINVNNKMAGNATIKSQSNGYRVSMGFFPALDRAKEVKFNIENIFPGGNVTFMLEHKREDYTTTQIFAGPYDSRAEAKSVLKELRSKKKYQGAFIVLF